MPTGLLTTMPLPIPSKVTLSENLVEERPASSVPKVILSPRSDVFTFENIPFGEYAVKVIHDENIDNNLDTNWLGIPKEAFGFSNNARARFGPPDFKDAMFKINKSEITITINLIRI